MYLDCYTNPATTLQTCSFTLEKVKRHDKVALTCKYMYIPNVRISQIIKITIQYITSHRLHNNCPRCNSSQQHPLHSNSDEDTYIQANCKEDKQQLLVLVSFIISSNRQLKHTLLVTLLFIVNPEVSVVQPHCGDI